LAIIYSLSKLYVSERGLLAARHWIAKAEEMCPLTDKWSLGFILFLKGKIWKESQEDPEEIWQMAVELGNSDALDELATIYEKKNDGQKWMTLHLGFQSNCTDSKEPIDTFSEAIARKPTLSPFHAQFRAEVERLGSMDLLINSYTQALANAGPGHQHLKCSCRFN
jgi:hypothetical protein